MALGAVVTPLTGENLVPQGIRAHREKLEDESVQCK
jgi:hypothetical protein